MLIILAFLFWENVHFLLVYEKQKQADKEALAEVRPYCRSVVVCYFKWITEWEGLHSSPMETQAFVIQLSNLFGAWKAWKLWLSSPCQQNRMLHSFSVLLRVIDGRVRCIVRTFLRNTKPCGFVIRPKSNVDKYLQLLLANSHAKRNSIY